MTYHDFFRLPLGLGQAEKPNLEKIRKHKRQKYMNNQIRVMIWK